MQPIGTVFALYRYPVKSLRAEALATAVVGASGFAGDRGSALIVHSPEHARNGKPYRGKEHRRLHTVATVTAARDLALGAGITVEAEVERDHYFDLEPISIVFDTWLRELEALAGRPVDPLQFRPNIVAAARPSFTSREADLTGARITIGDVALDVVAPITRCVTISYDIATGDADPALQRTLVQTRDNKMGIYARVATPGTIDMGVQIAVR